MESPSHQSSFNAERIRMVRVQLQDRGIRDLRVLDAMREVPRHEFVSEPFRTGSYEDHPLPIGCEQTISQPYIVAIMLEHLALSPADRILEVGTGSGYVTALLARLCGEVYSVERHYELAVSAKQRLKQLGCGNVKIKIGDGSLGWPDHAPFDAILVSAATAEMPPALFEQLREGGRMIAPVGPPFSQELQLVRKCQGLPEIVLLEGCRFVPLVEGDVDPG
jgi:protein-L-isoaspartate(D-aspartate) O-methyltransferase